MREDKSNEQVVKGAKEDKLRVTRQSKLIEVSSRVCSIECAECGA